MIFSYFKVLGPNLNQVTIVNFQNPDISLNESVEFDLAQDGNHQRRSQDRDTAPCVLQYIVFPPHTTTVKERYTFSCFLK